jgi:hypothetical protein
MGHPFPLGSSTAFDLAVWVDGAVATHAYSVAVNLNAMFANVAAYNPMIGTRQRPTVTG